MRSPRPPQFRPWRTLRTALGRRWQAWCDPERRRRWLAHHRPTLAAGLGIFVFGGLALSAVVPGRQIFEGNLLASEVSFTSDRPQRLLSTIDRLPSLELNGAITLRLLGKIETSSDRRLVGRDRLELRLAPTSRWQVSSRPAATRTGSSLSLDSLRLAQSTTVDRLSYTHANNRRLSLQLTSPPNHPSRLALTWGTQPLTVTLEGGFTSPELPAGQTGDRLTFTFRPEGDSPTLEPPATVALSLNLPSPDRVDPSEWLWPQLAVRNVRFERQQATTDQPEDDRPVSTLLGGTIRLAGQEAKLEPDRFLTFSGPGIRHLDKLHLKFPEKDSPQTGLTVQLTGEADQIEVGLNRDFPAVRLRASLLGRYFPNDFVIAVLSFSTAIVGSLLVWLLDRLFGNV